MSENEIPKFAAGFRYFPAGMGKNRSEEPHAAIPGSIPGGVIHSISERCLRAAAIYAATMDTTVGESVIQD